MTKRFTSLIMVMTMFFTSGCASGASFMTINLNEFVYKESFEFKGETDDNYSYNHDYEIADDNYRNFYEIFVRSFKDSNGDGIGDLNGVTQKLDYLSDLGITGIWLMPINPSHSYHKYDVDDYYAIDEQYGTLEDFKNLLSEADKRNIKIIMDLPLNHSSSNNKWFLEAYNAVRNGDFSNKYVNYYNFQKGAAPEYHNVNGTDYYYEGHFGSYMPDLNMDCEELKDEVKNIAAYWLNMGVYGFRLDAIFHLYPEISKTVAFCKQFREYCLTVKKDVFIVGEVWSTAADIAEFYKSGISSFGYILGGPMSSSASGGYLRAAIYPYYTKTIVEDIVAWQKKIKAVNIDALDSVFLTNHDNIRSAAQLKRNIYAIKFAAALYLFSPGASFTYYGEEIGMMGGGTRDENYRAPMYWSDNTEDLTDPPEKMEEITQFFPSAEEQIKYTNSIYATYKRLLRIRNENPEIARGTAKIIDLNNENIGALSLSYNGQTVYILHNLSVSPTTITISESDLIYNEIRGYSCPTGESIITNGKTFTLPAYASLILK